MTSKLTREWLQHQISEIEVAGITDSNTLAAFKLALAAMGSEPVAWDYEWASYITCDGPQDFKRVIEREAPPEWAIEEGQARNVIPLYRHAQQPVVQPAVIPEWTNEQCLEFLSIAFRHAEIKGDLAMDDIRLGIKMVNASRPAKRKTTQEIVIANRPG